MIDKFWESNLLRELIFAPRTYFLSNLHTASFLHRCTVFPFLAQELWPNPANTQRQMSMSVGKPRQSRVPAQPGTSMTHRIDGPEEVVRLSYHITTCVCCSGFCQDCPLGVSQGDWRGAGAAGGTGRMQVWLHHPTSSCGSSPSWMYSAHNYNQLHVDPYSCKSLFHHPQENLIWPRYWNQRTSCLFLPLLRFARATRPPNKKGP